MPVINRFAELHDDITAWRRDIHAHPELLFDTHRTSALVAEKLRSFGCDEVVEGIGRTGVVGVIRGRSQASNRAVGLRADMDALPLEEETDLPYASKTKGAMHACGHDGHTAMLLGAAQYLAETRNFDGTAVVIFQPAEEGGGGAREMVEDGLMERFGINEVYGMHNSPTMPAGDFGLRAGPMLAAADQFTIEVTGRGGHAARPHQGIDPTLAASQIVVALQSIASRSIDPMKQVVVSVTSFSTSSETFNIIPARVKLLGTARTLEESVRDQVEERLREIVTGTATAFGTSVDITYERNYPVMVNDAGRSRFAAETAVEISGAERVDNDRHAAMGGEDFSFMLNERPGAMIWIGNGVGPRLHNPAYNFNDEIIPAGCSYWVRLVERALPSD